MIQLIVGAKGKGKTKILLDKVNTEIKEAHGSIVYLDKSTKHMYELNNKIRLIDVSGSLVSFVALFPRITTLSRCTLTASLRFPCWMRQP